MKPVFQNMDLAEPLTQKAAGNDCVKIKDVSFLTLPMSVVYVFVFMILSGNVCEAVRIQEMSSLATMKKPNYGLVPKPVRWAFIKENLKRQGRHGNFAQ